MFLKIIQNWKRKRPILEINLFKWISMSVFEEFEAGKIMAVIADVIVWTTE